MSIWGGIEGIAKHVVHGIEDGAKDVAHGAKVAASDAKGAFDHALAVAKSSAPVQGVINDVRMVKALFSPGAQSAVLSQSVNQLRYNGDQTTLSVTANGQVTGTDPVGVQGQGSATITIKQVGGPNAAGENGPVKPVTYQVTLTETDQGGINEALGQDKKFGKDTIKGKAGVQADIGVTSSVTLTFTSKQGAESAAKSLLKVAAFEQTATSVKGELLPGSPLIGGAAFTNPTLQAIDRSGPTGEVEKILSDIPGISHFVLSGSESSFLQSHITSSSSSVTLTGTGQASVSIGDLQNLLPKSAANNGPLSTLLSLGGASLSAKGSNAITLTRTVTTAQGTPGTAGYTPGTVGYTLANSDAVTGSAGLNLKFNIPGTKPITGEDGNPKTGPNGGLKYPTLKLSLPSVGATGTATGSITLNYDLKPGQSGNPVDGLFGGVNPGGLSHPSQIQTQFQWQTGPYSDGGVLPYKNQSVHTFTFKATLNNASNYGFTQQAGFVADPYSPTYKPDASISVTDTNGSATSTSKIALDPSVSVGDIGVSAGVNVNITTTLLNPPGHVPTQQPKHEPTPAHQPHAPPHGIQYTVLPQGGLNIRSDPSTHGHKLDAIFNGSFVQSTGATRTDAQHNVWLQVHATGMDGRHITGWVEAKYLAPHPQGSLAGTGRIDHDREHGGYVPEVVQPGENLSELAAHYGISLSQIESANGQHIIDPSLIFPGDVVYIPESAASKTGPTG